MADIKAYRLLWMPDHIQYYFYQGSIFYMPDKKLAIAVVDNKCFGEYFINVRDLSNPDSNPADRIYLNTLEEAIRQKRVAVKAESKDQAEFIFEMEISEADLAILASPAPKKEELNKIIARLLKF